MNTQLIPFAFGEQMLRVIERDGVPWFIAADACAILDLENVTRALATLDDDELTLLKVRSGGQEREMNVISEPGLYRLVFKSRKPAAKAFQRWVYHEVLPAIRRTGSYCPNHQAFLGLIREQIALGVPADLAARNAAKLCPAAPGTVRLPGSSSRQQAGYDEEVQEVLNLMTTGRTYTVDDIIALLPSHHRLLRGSMPARRSSIGKILERARRDDRLEKLWNSRKATYQLPEIAPFSATTE